MDIPMDILMVRGCGHQYGYPRPATIYLEIYTDLRADVSFVLSVLLYRQFDQGTDHGFLGPQRNYLLRIWTPPHVVNPYEDCGYS